MGNEDQSACATGRCWMRLAVVAALAIAVAGVIYLKHQRDETGAARPAQDAAPAAPERRVPAAAAATSDQPEPALPKLVDLGAGTCIPCKMMAPILERLREEYAGSLEVVFIDVREDPAAAELYGIQQIPTQIFFDASGKELFRHIGFFAKEGILAKWKELGIDLSRAGKVTATSEPAGAGGP